MNSGLKSLITSEGKVMFKQHSDETLNCQINTTEDIKRYDKDLLSLSMNTQLHVTNRK